MRHGSDARPSNALLRPTQSFLPEFVSGKKKERPTEPFYKYASRNIVESNFVVGFTTFLTIYALIGEDIKTIFTNAGADGIFDVFTGICLVIFTVEIILSIFGKKEYFLGFFFVLDVVSTATLIMDFSAVSYSLVGEYDEGQLKASKSARVGAKAGRMVRVIRLVRIFKLYKAYIEAKARAKRAEEKKARGPGDDEDGDGQESRVGQQLSQMTTRRVIILVLVVLIVLPFFDIPAYQVYASSVNYGMDDIWLKYSKFYPDAIPDIGANVTNLKQRYQDMFLRFAFYQNWYVGNNHMYPDTDGCPSEQSSCSANFLTHLFWMGVHSKTLANAMSAATAARLDQSYVNSWIDKHITNAASLDFEFGAMPAPVYATLGNAWTECPAYTRSDGVWHRVGLSLLASEVDTPNGRMGHAVGCPGELRPPELRRAKPQLITKAGEEEFSLLFYFDNRNVVIEAAQLNLLTTLFICIVLVSGSLVFARDANRLVLGPVEVMIQKIEKIRTNPLYALEMADNEFKKEETTRGKSEKAAAWKEKMWMWELGKQILTGTGGLGKQKQEPMETVILEKTIIKLGTLLALGFGEAGANIIASNMHGSDSAGVDAMAPGIGVDCCVGVISIRNFQVATEVLQAKVMTFVNQIAEIVHGLVDEFHGAANKNTGSTFITVWRMEDWADEDYDFLVGRNCEMAITACAKIVGAVNANQTLAQYRSHPGLQQRLMDCRVSLSFGLHFGWAIEGAVGSEFKIDPSYISPNVSMAQSIENATSVYGTNIIVSETCVALCDPAITNCCRLIDQVVITGSTQPLKIYSLDLDPKVVSVEECRARTFNWNPRQRYNARQKMKTDKEEKLAKEGLFGRYWQNDHDVVKMRRKYDVKFNQKFIAGFQNYTQGEWPVARRLLNETRVMTGEEDGPSNALLRFMEGTDFEAPPGWAGYHDLSKMPQPPASLRISPMASGRVS